MVFLDWMASVLAPQAYREASKKKTKENVSASAHDGPKSRTPKVTAQGAYSTTLKVRSQPSTSECGEHPKAQSKHQTSTFMRPSPYCLTPRQFLDRISRRRISDVNYQKVANYRNWIQTSILPRLNAGGGRACSVPEMERFIAFFGEFIFWNLLPRTRFAWRDNLFTSTTSRGGILGCTDPNGRWILVDANPPLYTAHHGQTLGDHILSILAHECCHAVFDFQACTGRCGSRRCADAYATQIQAKAGHGSAWVSLAKGAEDIINKHNLFHCRTVYEKY